VVKMDWDDCPSDKTGSYENVDRSVSSSILSTEHAIRMRGETTAAVIGSLLVV